MTSEQKEGHGKERKAREKPDTPSFPTPPAAVPTPQPRFPKPLMLHFICSRNQSWVVPWAGVLLEQTVIFTTMVFGKNLLLVFYYLVNLYLCPWLKLKMKEEGVTKAPTASSAGRWQNKKTGRSKKKGALISKSHVCGKWRFNNRP